MTCAHTIVKASHWVGLTFPGIILLPGSFSGRMSSPRPQRGPLPNNRISLAIFIKEAAMVLRAPLVSTKASWAAKASNLFSAVTKGRLVSSATAAAILASNLDFIQKTVTICPNLWLQKLNFFQPKREGRW
ncbi:hypothetical protein V8G54_030832 [Vigna mungo]|uniref:Uncharacterized protein n=1 Tax=Vigna mungo TaxID=3915 RepID=A0AAQ3RLM6_VIGMU